MGEEERRRISVRERGNHVDLIWEGGPFEWTMIAAGTDMLGPEFGNYSDPAQVDINSN